MINKYEFHFQTTMNLSEMIEKMKASGHDFKIELLHKGLEISVHNRSTGLHLMAEMKLYECINGVYEYEVKSHKRDEFMKLLEIFDKA